MGIKVVKGGEDFVPYEIRPGLNILKLVEIIDTEREVIKRVSGGYVRGPEREEVYEFVFMGHDATGREMRLTRQCTKVISTAGKLSNLYQDLLVYCPNTDPRVWEDAKLVEALIEELAAEVQEVPRSVCVDLAKQPSGFVKVRGVFEVPSSVSPSQPIGLSGEPMKPKPTPPKPIEPVQAELSIDDDDIPF